MTRANRLRALVVGGGVAGLSAGWWLHHVGCDVEVVESDCGPTPDGALLDLFGSGHGVAEEMGLLAELELRAPTTRRWIFEDRNGERLGALEYSYVRRRVFGGRHVAVPSADLQAAIRARTAGQFQVRYGEAVAAVQPCGAQITVAFKPGRSRAYDLVVGADETAGFRRSAWVGRDGAREQDLGFDAVSFSVHDPELRLRLGDDRRILSAPHCQASIQPGRAGRIHVALLVRRPAVLVDDGTDRFASELDVAFCGFSEHVRRLVAFAPHAADLRHERVVQLHLRTWSTGGVVLARDPCQWPSPVRGRGESLSLSSARTLAREIEQAPNNLPRALARYEASMRPVVERAQALGAWLGRCMLPSDTLGRVARRVGLRAAGWPFASGLAGRLLGASEHVNAISTFVAGSASARR